MPSIEKITILFLAANPQDTDQLKLDEEVRAIDQSLRLAEHRDRFDLRSHWALRYSDLTALLLRYTPQIVHFSGHGSSSGELAFGDDQGKAHLVAPDTLADLFSILRDNIRCVVLNACYSETQALGIARSIDCVVGMKRAVADDAAVAFAANFYLGLGYGRSIATAFALGRNSMGALAADEEKTPKLFDPHKKAATIVLAGNSGEAGDDTAALPRLPQQTTFKGRQVQAAMVAILSAYPSEADLAQMVKFYLDENLAAIAGGSNLKDKVFNLLEWARMRGRTTELLRAAVEGNPHNLELRQFFDTLQ